MLTPVDRAEFDQAVALIRGIIDRHPRELTAPLLIAVQATVHDIGVVARYLDSVELM